MFEIFPSAFVDNSLLTAVLVGVFLLWMLAERFGWPATGLVVPGYLGAVLAVRPEAGLIILLEAMATYGLAHLLGRWLPRVLPVDRVFGRDRFFLIILVSIFVRLLVEGDWGQSLLGSMGFGVASGWHSLGLVLVPLTANAFWKPGLMRGLPLMGLPVLVVFALFTWVLLPLTNLDFGQFELTYEDLRFSFFESPREYIIVLLGALIASHATVRYGWDFGGIIVCGLLAISWLSPLKLVATLAEIGVVVTLMRILTSVRPLKSANISGLRPIVLGFTLSYLVKLAIAWVSQGAWPGFRVGEVFGFGYLLPAIVSVRVWRKGGFAQVLMPALAISLVAVVLGQLVGMGLVELRGGTGGQAEGESIVRTGGPAERAVIENLLPAPEQPRRVDDELYAGVAAARSMESWTGQRIQVDAYNDGAVVHTGDLGWIGTGWFRESEDDLIEIIVPEAALQPGLAELAVVVAERVDAPVVLLSPSAELRRAAHRSGRVRMVVQVDPELETAVLVADRRVPRELDLAPFEILLPGFQTDFDLVEPGADMALRVPEDDLLRLILAGGFDLPVSQQGVDLLTDDFPRPTENDPRGGLSVRDLANLDRGVVQPMLDVTQGGDPRWLRVAAANAARLGMVVSDDGEVIGLGPEDPTEPPRFTLWLRRGGEPLAFEVRGGGRHLWSHDVGRSWWSQTDAMALLVHDAGMDLDAEAVRVAGPWAPELVILRDLARARPGLDVISLDVSREDEIPGASGVVSDGTPLDPRYDKVPDLMWRAAGLVAGAGGSWTWYDASERRIRFYDPANPRRDAVRALGGDYVTVYLSQPFRLRYAGTGPDSPLTGLLQHARIRLIEDDLERIHALPDATLPEDLARTLARLDVYRESGHPGHVALLRKEAGAAGYSVSAFTDLRTGLTLLEIEGQGRLIVTPFGYHPESSEMDPRWLPGPRIPIVKQLPQDAEEGL